MSRVYGHSYVEGFSDGLKHLGYFVSENEDTQTFRNADGSVTFDVLPFHRHKLEPGDPVMLENRHT